MLAIKENLSPSFIAKEFGIYVLKVLGKFRVVGACLKL
jgi:hypothetical protein